MKSEKKLKMRDYILNMVRDHPGRYDVDSILTQVRISPVGRGIPSRTVERQIYTSVRRKRIVVKEGGFFPGRKPLS